MTRNEKKTAIENMAERFMSISDLEGKSMAISSMTTSQSHSTGKPPHRSIKWVQETLRALWRYMQKAP